jgi:hypothetical protein
VTVDVRERLRPRIGFGGAMRVEGVCHSIAELSARFVLWHQIRLDRTEWRAFGFGSQDYGQTCGDLGRVRAGPGDGKHGRTLKRTQGRKVGHGCVGGRVRLLYVCPWNGAIFRIDSEKFIHFCYISNMLKLSSILPDLVTADPFLQYGLQYGIFNLSKLAAHLKPFVEVRAKKSMSTSAILMALSRHQRSLTKVAAQPQRFVIQSIAVHTGLGTFSFPKTEETLKKIHQLHTQVLRKNGYITISEGTGEVTCIVDRAYAPLIKTLVGKPKFQNTAVSALAIHFPAAYAEVPGFLCVLLQQVMLQGINLVEIASTFTEFVLYIDESNTKLAFDTIYSLFEVQDEA